MRITKDTLIEISSSLPEIGIIQKMFGDLANGFWHGGCRYEIVYLENILDLYDSITFTEKDGTTTTFKAIKK